MNTSQMITRVLLTVFVHILLPEATAILTWDPKGYVIYCPCMGRFGNQADHFLGALGFAKAIDRTLVLPPWRTYKNIPFDEWFQVDLLSKYHRVVLAKDFMTELAPVNWPVGQRYGWCWLPPSQREKTNCHMKEGNPFGPFWDGLGIDFGESVIYDLVYDYSEPWIKKYYPSKYPVMAFRGAPASFPVKEKYVSLHRYLKWSTAIFDEATQYVNKNFPNQTFIGIHLRNGKDWENSCRHAEDQTHYMSSPQCLGYTGTGVVTKDICFPTLKEILRLTKKVVTESSARVVFIATDQTPYSREIEDHLKDQQVRVFHLDPWLPQIDLAILGMADYFIGNCVSSFTAFVARERNVNNKPTYFWGQNIPIDR